METREKKMVEVTEMREKEIDGVLKLVPVKVQRPEYPKVKKEVERVAIFPRIIELIKEEDKPLWFVRYGQISSMIATNNYRIIVVESTDEVVCKIKNVETISRVADLNLETKLGASGEIVPVKVHTDWKNVLEAIKPKPVSGDGMLKAPQEAFDDFEKKKKSDKKE